MAASAQIKLSSSLPLGVAPALHKRDRPASSNDLLRLDNAEPAAKQVHACAAPLLETTLGEPMSAFFHRLACALDASPFSVANSFDRDGIYLYKRPVRSHSNQAALLTQAGSVFHHCVVYLKTGGELAALEFGPNNAMDVTVNFMEEVLAAPVLCSGPAPQPEPECLPMLHISAPHHPLDAQHVQQALRFAESRPYHALKNNCIAFADFCVRVLTGGVVRNAPIIFDLIAGKVPAQDSPLLAFLLLAAQLTWFSVCDGSPLTAAFLEQHPSALPPPSGATGASAATAAGGSLKADCLCTPGSITAAAAATEAEEVAVAAAAACATTAMLARAPAALAPAAALPADSGASEDSVWASRGQLLPAAALRSSGSSRSLPSSSASHAVGGRRFDPLGRAAPRSKAAAAQE